MICSECGHGMFKHKMICRFYHDGSACGGPDCNKAKFLCSVIEVARWFGQDIICGCFGPLEEKIAGEMAQGKFL